MRFFERLSNGWRLGKISLLTIRENPSLIVFPFISGISLILVTLSFFGSGYLAFGEEILAIADDEIAANSLDAILYVMVFLFYILNYFIIVFFNVGLVHCARRILEGHETTVREGINYATTRVGSILSWAILAATVGMILKAIQENSGTFGQIISGIIGMVWGIATFFVVPIIAYEDVNPIEAVKRSGQIMKDKWGESIGANFSFGLFSLLGTLLVALPAGFLIGAIIHPVAGVVTGVMIFILIQMSVSAANMVFLAAAYQHVNDQPTGYFESDILDDVFVRK
jgi:uncharacterized membrane protein YeaQ/YmgE (transglycosylase-associated protein family)